MIVADSSVLAAYILCEEPVWEAIEKLIIENYVYTLGLAIKEALNTVWKSMQS
jgi:predicted nucleic acid-binding protein